MLIIVTDFEGNSHEFTSFEAVKDFARTHLDDWMEDTDGILHSRSDDGLSGEMFVVNELSEPTDARILYQIIPCDKGAVA